jgi:hypothetical protein
MTNPVQIPDAAVQAFRQSFESTDNNCDTYQDVRKALAAALPHLPLGYEVKRLIWSKPPLSDTLSRCETVFGTYRTWTHDEAQGKWFWSLEGCIETQGEEADEVAAKAAAQADFERRVRECHVPRPDIKTIIDEIRAGTRQGFLNEGDQPEPSDEELSCPHCGGSGHIDDVATKPVDVAAVHSSSLIELLHNMRFRLENMGSTDDTDANLVERIISHVDAIRALSAEPAKGEQWSEERRNRAAFNLTMAIRNMTGGEWEPSIHQSFKILEAALAPAPTSEAGR